MNKYEDYRTFKFTSKLAANEFLSRINKVLYKCDVATVFDILRLAGKPIPSDGKVDGFKYGYAKKDIKNIKPAKVDGVWTIYLPFPGKMVRDDNTNHWTTVSEDGDE